MGLQRVHCRTPPKLKMAMWCKPSQGCFQPQDHADCDSRESDLVFEKPRQHLPVQHSPCQAVLEGKATTNSPGVGTPHGLHVCHVQALHGGDGVPLWQRHWTAQVHQPGVRRFHEQANIHDQKEYFSIEIRRSILFNIWTSFKDTVYKFIYPQFSNPLLAGTTTKKSWVVLMFLCRTGVSSICLPGQSLWIHGFMLKISKSPMSTWNLLKKQLPKLHSRRFAPRFRFQTQSKPGQNNIRLNSDSTWC